MHFNEGLKRRPIAFSAAEAVQKEEGETRGGLFPVGRWVRGGADAPRPQGSVRGVFNHAVSSSLPPGPPPPLTQLIHELDYEMQMFIKTFLPPSPPSGLPAASEPPFKKKKNFFSPSSE